MHTQGLHSTWDYLFPKDILQILFIAINSPSGELNDPYASCLTGSR